MCYMNKSILHIAGYFTLLLISCQSTGSNDPYQHLEGRKPVSEPLVSHIYTADPSAHVFEGRIFIYPSHDTATGMPRNAEGDHFDMKDYRILSMDSIGGTVIDHGVALSLSDIPWVTRQLWAPDAAEKDGRYYLFFAAKDSADLFRMGVATSHRPEGPFTAEPAPIKGSYSIDPAVFKDSDGEYYMYFGGISGGQLQYWDHDNQYHQNDLYNNPEAPAALPRVARLSSDLLEFAEAPRPVQLIDSTGRLFTVKENDKRFFEAAWMHRYNGTYYFSYSTGDTHYICYATGDNPYGPFTYRGIILQPVVGWTTHHSITAINGQWYLFYHDAQLSGETPLRNVKVTPLRHLNDGSIEMIDPYF